MKSPDSNYTMFKTILKTYPKVYRVNVSFYIGVYTYMNLSVFTHKKLGNRMVFKRKKLSRLKKLRLLQITLTIQRSSKVNSCDNNVEYSTAQFTSQLGVEPRKKAPSKTLSA